MNVLVIDGDTDLLQALQPKSVDVLIFLTGDRLTPARAKLLAPIAASKLAIGGAAVIANTIEEAMERL